MHVDASSSSDVERSVLDLVGRAMGRFAMLRPGDRVAVGVSGGKDSLCLLHALVAHGRRAPFPYEVVAVTIEQGKFKAPIRALEPQIRALGVPWELRDEPATLELVANGVLHGCDVCSRHRRRALYTIAGELGCTALALGHTADDRAEESVRREIRTFLAGLRERHPGVAESVTAALGNVNPYTLFDPTLTRPGADVPAFEAPGA